MLKPLNAAPVNIFASIPDYILQKQNVLGLFITLYSDFDTKLFRSGA